VLLLMEQSVYTHGRPRAICINSASTCIWTVACIGPYRCSFNKGRQSLQMICSLMWKIQIQMMQMLIPCQRWRLNN